MCRRDAEHGYLHTLCLTDKEEAQVPEDNSSVYYYKAKNAYPRHLGALSVYVP